MSLLPDARLWTDDARAVTDRWDTAPGYGTHRTSLVGYRGVDSNSVSSVEDIVAGGALAQADGVGAVDIGYGRDGEGLGFRAETRDDVGAHLIDPCRSPRSPWRLTSTGSSPTAAYLTTS